MFNTIALNKRGLTATLTLTVILLTFMFTLVSASAVSYLDEYEWDLDSDGTPEFGIGLISGSVYEGPGLGYNWTYEVYSSGSYSTTSTNTPGISHWILAFCGGREAILDSNYIDDIAYGKDPSGTDIWGIKFDTSFPTGYTKVWFTLDADYPSAEVPVGLKPGQLILQGTIQGPVAYTFNVDITINNTGVGPLGWEMSTTATDSSGDIDRVVFKWYGPFTSETTSSVGLTAVLTTTDDSSPFEGAYGALTDDDLGWWLVIAEFYVDDGGYYLKAYVSATMDLIIETPWFTSLPLALLITVGTVLFLRKKGRLGLSV